LDLEPGPERFDLVTFPEAFVDAGTLVEAMENLAGFGPSGCFHVGLRPSNECEPHLFSFTELNDLIDQLAQISASAATDISEFRKWLNCQRSDHVFNVACLFAVDAQRHLRVCLHPKIVPSQLEIGPLPEQNMKGANLLTLITLWPVDKQYFSVTLQPLICSDALGLATDQPGGAPMEAVNRYAECFGKQPPDHIDVVSVVTCTRQSEGKTRDETPFREWHELFRDAFKNAADGSNFARVRRSGLTCGPSRSICASPRRSRSNVWPG
jgi:hypothetical protein